VLLVTFGIENKYKEIKLEISLLEDDLEMIEDKEMLFK
tara:strand:- start:259 stop:372 length:114 start_codon:yes stop_codon:yes gene_type:complete